MGGHILVVDQGTPSTRAVVFEERAKAIASAEMEFRRIHPPPGWIEHDPEDIWRTLDNGPGARDTTPLAAALLAGWRVGLYSAPEAFMRDWDVDRRFASTMNERTRRKRRAGWRSAVEASVHHRETTP